VKLAQFNKLLKECPEAELNTFAQKYIFHGTPYVFTGREEEYFEFRNRIARQFGLGFHEVFIVGSAKQGFSYVKNRDVFDFNSDIDVAIVSAALFEQFAIIIREYQYALSSGQVTHTQNESKKYTRFLKYYAKGWIRPDMAKDIINQHESIDDWDAFFKSISFGKSEVGDYKVAAGIFKSYDYLQRYHYQGLLSRQNSLKAKP